ncbi:4a-hydroxytetrahydrobiopterin dehydratase [Streptomyces daliensis]|uniref:Putative pterin-4-alpha-carbinolamine dehydratase n=1 Tax=Streptomyces daliensis TaxID=299421 RepID=A0A8T4J7V8_9ACTN|nr:4a-hydroxytetrahydrobiopterin dehydratase [Streptomyces daliensis]
MAERDPLTEDQVREHLARWDGWSGDTRRISKTYQLDYYTSITVINEMAETAQRLQHHPDVDLRWQTLTFSITTYTAGAVVTALDFNLVAELERITAAHGATTAP